MKRDLYDTVTASIIAALEAGTPPWAPAWTGGTGCSPVALPLRHNGIPYQGVNILLLWAAASAAGYRARRWLTFKQALELGGNVRKGEKGHMVVYAGSIEREREGEGGDTEIQRIPFLKSYTVFNAEQCDGLGAEFAADVPLPAPIVAEGGRLPACEAWLAATGASITESASDGAYYRPSTDQIVLPAFGRFAAPAHYYATAAHELVHWTKAETRLNRTFDGSRRFGSDAYAMEELVAEIGAAYVAAELGIIAETRDDHASYIAGWLKILKADNRAIFTAASHASRAAQYLASLQPGGGIDRPAADGASHPVLPRATTVAARLAHDVRKIGTSLQPLSPRAICGAEGQLALL